MGVKISELTSATSLTGSEELPIVQAGNTKKATINQVKAQNYSTTEQVVGTWIDGKPIYRKTYEDSTSSTSYQISVSGLNIDKVTNIYGIAKEPSGETEVPAGFHLSSTAYFNLVYNSSGIGVRTVDGYKDYTKYITIEYTKTTDTATQTRSANLTMNTGSLVGSGEKSNLLLEDFSGDVKEEVKEETPLEKESEKESGENDELR